MKCMNRSGHYGYAYKNRKHLIRQADYSVRKNFALNELFELRWIPLLPEEGFL